MAEKPTFIEFLKSVRIKERSTADAAESATARFNWSVPEQWRSVSPGQMQVAKFTVPEHDGGKADVTVSIFPSDTGGTLANVNRWRKQVGLEEIGESELAPLVTPLDPPGSAATLVDLVNGQRRLLGAIVQRGTQWFFYKLLGDAAAVSAAHDAFVEFVKSQP